MIEGLSLAYQEFSGEKEIPDDVGRIIALQRGSVSILTAHGQLSMRLSSNLVGDDLQLTVGDWCRLDTMTDTVTVINYLPRKSTLSRKVSGKQLKEQMIASNIDLLCVCLSMRGAIRPSVISRYLFVLSGNYRQLLVFTQKDLCSDVEMKMLEVSRAFPHIPMISISAIHGDVTALYDHVNPGETLALVGPSGVGKSTLINHLIGTEEQKTSPFSLKTKKGCHTTVGRSMHYCEKTQTWLIDTPGMRELGIWDISQENSMFGEMYYLAKACKFSNCTHTVEPHCRIQEALCSGEITPEEYRQFIKLEQEKKAVYKAKHQCIRKNVKRKL